MEQAQEDMGSWVTGFEELQSQLRSSISSPLTSSSGMKSCFIELSKWVEDLRSELLSVGLERAEKLRKLQGMFQQLLVVASPVRERLEELAREMLEDTGDQ